jgi:dTDP-glucose 4,6-dehydratase
MSKRILLTGAGGFIGHHTLEHILKTTDWEVVCLESFRHKGISARLREVLDANPTETNRVSILTHNIMAPIDSVTAREIGHVDVIINMASESHVDRSLEEPRHFIENNIMLVTTMLDYARTLPSLELFIQISTDEVYGPAHTEKGHPEYDAILPSNPYSASKAAQEAIAIAYWRSYDVPVVITNTMNIIGERQDPEKFVPKTIKKLLSGEKMPVHGQVVDGKWVSGSRFYLHARNQADALTYIIKHASSHKLKKSEGVPRPLRFHVGGEREVSNDEMANLIASFMDLTGNWVEYNDVGNTRPGHDLRYGLQRGTLEEWGWKPAVPFNESLKNTVLWTLDHKYWLDI